MTYTVKVRSEINKKDYNSNYYYDVIIDCSSYPMRCIIIIIICECRYIIIIIIIISSRSIFSVLYNKI